MTHSPEPWGCHDQGTEFPTICKEREDGSCHEIAELTGCQGMTHEEKVANGERIIACQGIPTEKLPLFAATYKRALELEKIFAAESPCHLDDILTQWCKKLVLAKELKDKAFPKDEA